MSWNAQDQNIDISSHIFTPSLWFMELFYDDKYYTYPCRRVQFVQTNFYQQSSRHSKPGSCTGGDASDWYLTGLLTIYKLCPDMETSFTNHITKQITGDRDWEGLHWKYLSVKIPPWITNWWMSAFRRIDNKLYLIEE